jgi:hypothetical protein
MLHLSKMNSQGMKMEHSYVQDNKVIPVRVYISDIKASISMRWTVVANDLTVECRKPTSAYVNPLIID